MAASRTPSTIAVPDMRTLDVPRELRILVASTGSISVGFTERLFPRLMQQPHVIVEGLVDSELWKESSILHDYTITSNAPYESVICREQQLRNLAAQRKAASLSEWADLLVLAPMDADTLAKMLHGMADTLLLDLLRNWDVSKKILLVPGMSVTAWENPMTKKQLNKIRRKWNWIRVLQPLLYRFGKGIDLEMLDWNCLDDLADTIRNQVDLMTIGQEVDIALGAAPKNHQDRSSKPRSTSIQLPPEIWTMVFEYHGDWELAKALGVYTTLPTPPEWQRHGHLDKSQLYMKELEYTILTGSLTDVANKLRSCEPPVYLSRLCVKLIIKFGLINLLSYLESNYKELFWATFGHTLLPTKASAAFGRVEVLEWWRTSPSFLTKEYSSEAIDGASKAGFVHVLDWWKKSGLPLRYTEAALEQASSKGHIEVLEWWKNASMHEGSYSTEAENVKHFDGDTQSALDSSSTAYPIPSSRRGSAHPCTLPLHLSTSSSLPTTSNLNTIISSSFPFTPAPSAVQTKYRTRISSASDLSSFPPHRPNSTPPTLLPPSSSTSSSSSSSPSLPQNQSNLAASLHASSTPIRLKVGRSICFAAQAGQTATVKWWDESGIPYSHEETVAKIASTHGHVPVLVLWKSLKAEKMIYDNQVLVGPTKNGHADVLEWWKRSGFRVEYKTCDIEEALEDSLGGKGEEMVRIWWARNGLNLGVGTSEWMKVKVL